MYNQERIMIYIGCHLSMTGDYEAMGIKMVDTER